MFNIIKIHQMQKMTSTSFKMFWGRNPRSENIEDKNELIGGPKPDLAPGSLVE